MSSVIALIMEDYKRFNFPVGALITRLNRAALILMKVDLFYSPSGALEMIVMQTFNAVLKLL